MSKFTDWLRGRQPEPIEPPSHGPLEEAEQGDWIVVPYRILEAARLSLYTIASHPEQSDQVRWAVLQWLDSFNTHLALYFQENYGEEVFPLLEQVSKMVREASEAADSESATTSFEDLFNKWEAQFDDGN